MPTDRKAAIEAILDSRPAVARITTDLLSEALAGFELKPVRELSWFVEELRPVVYMMAGLQEPRGNSEVRDELFALADCARELWNHRWHISSEAKDRLSTLASRLHHDKRFQANSRMKRALSAYYDREHPFWLAEFIEMAAREAGSERQPPKWKSKKKQLARVWFAETTIPLFEEGFGKRAVVNKWPSNARGVGASSLGTWADFYQRMMAALLGERATPNLEEVLSHARANYLRGAIHKESGTQIPD